MKKNFIEVWTLKIKFAGMFIIIFVIIAPKYVLIASLKLIGGKCFLEVYSKCLFRIGLGHMRFEIRMMSQIVLD